MMEDHHRTWGSKWVVEGIDLGGFGMGWDMEGIEEKELTEAIRPVAEAAATARLDCRRAFLNIVI